MGEAVNRNVNVAVLLNSFPAVTPHYYWSHGHCTSARTHVGHFSESEDNISIQYNR